MSSKNVVLVGLGPHAKRIYMKCFEINHFQPAIIIDLESNKETLEEYVKKNNITSQLYFVRESARNARQLSEEDEYNIIAIIKEKNITHAIISTEPKAHYMYICLFLKNKIHVLVDKPLTALTNVSNNIDMAKMIKKDYEDIRNLYDSVKNQNIILQMQCQRRWHRGYRFAHELAEDIVKKYNIPITAIQVSHCDGMWNMPDEFLTRENHPYKYGYGKLFHSGYHFVDLVAWFETINDSLVDKSANNVELYATAVRPSDFLCMIDKNNYHQLFNDSRFDKIFDNINDHQFDRYGELDLYSILQFKHDEKVISTAILNLMQNGFSRRSWNSIPEDTYKANGRVRHEYMNLEIGPLMNIQIHSYQSKEIKDKIEDNYDVGEVEHFDVFVYRNIDLIGGKPMEKYTLKDLYENSGDMQGYNEKARECCFREFIDCTCNGNPIYDHELGIEILSREYEALCRQKENKVPIVKFLIHKKRENV